MRILRAVFAVGLIAGQTSSADAQAAGLLWGSLTPGSYAVGFRTLYMRDTTRTWRRARPSGGSRDPGRPIRISLWYPALPVQTSPVMSYGDYFHYSGPADFRALNDTLERSDRESWISDMTELTPTGRSLAAKLFAIRVAAHAGAPIAPGRFPVLFYAAGKNSRADANVELGEYLASHGYIVVTVPQLGASEESIGLGSAPAEILLHETDLEFAWRVMKRLPSVDSIRLAIAGHSAGGVVAVQYGMTHPEVRAVVGLDGSYGMHGEQRPATVTRPTWGDFPDYMPTRLIAPLLDLRRADGVQGAVLDSSVIAALQSSDRYTVAIPRMYHGDFTEFAPIAVYLGLPWAPRPDGRTRQTGLEGNQHVNRAVLDFLEASVRQVAGALDAMNAELSGIEGVVVTHRPRTLRDARD